MINDLVHRVLSCVEAVAPDGGDAVVAALTAEIGRLIPFDEGELALTLCADMHRRPLTPQGAPLVAADVLAHLCERHGFVQLDDLLATQQHALTRDLLAGRQLRSLLAVPIVFGGAPRGALALAARRTSGFVGAPAQALSTLASAAGLALFHALKLSGLRDEREALRHEVRRLSTALAERDQAAFQARCESEAREAEREAMRRALDELRRRDEAAPAAPIATAAQPLVAGTPAASGANGRRRRH
jgi:transcriptional regulator with GAF, ATPase, and Fis domain